MNRDGDFLFVLADPSRSALLAESCQARTWKADFAVNFDEALSAFDEKKFKVILIDIDDTQLHGLQIFEWLKSRNTFSVIGVMANKTYGANFLNALQLGSQTTLSQAAWDKSETLILLLEESLSKFKDLLERQIHVCHSKATNQMVSWVGSHALVQANLTRAKEEAGTQFPVLIQGEVGVGKEQLAQVIALESQALQTFFFHAEHVADYEQKQNWQTVLSQLKPDQPAFLCVTEITQLIPELQEVLSEFLRNEGLHLGNEVCWPHLKFVATTSENVDFFVRAGKFRKDLALLLAQNQILVPDLASRKEDIAILAAYFLETEFRPGQVCYFSDDALVALKTYDWPGQVTELKNMVQAACTSVKGVMIKAKDLPHEILDKSFYVQSTSEENWGDLSYNDAKKIALNKFNKEYIAELLDRSKHNLTVAAEIAGMDRSNFKKIIRKYFPED